MTVDEQPDPDPKPTWAGLEQQSRAVLGLSAAAALDQNDPRSLSGFWGYAQTIDPKMSPERMRATAGLFARNAAPSDAHVGRDRRAVWSVAICMNNCMYRVGRRFPFAVLEAGAEAGWGMNETDVVYERLVRQVADEFRGRPRQMPGIGGETTEETFVVAVRWAGRQFGLEKTAAVVLLQLMTGLPVAAAARWVGVLWPTMRTRQLRSAWAQTGSRATAAEELEEEISGWVAAAGPDGWMWAAAGFTLAETRVLYELPETHPARPGPDQLAVMAALREPDGDGAFG